MSISRLVEFGLSQEVGTLLLNVFHGLVLNLPFDVTKSALILVDVCLEFIQVDRSFRLFNKVRIFIVVLVNVLLALQIR